MKTKIKNLVISGFAMIAIAITTSCEQEAINSDNEQYATVLDVSADGTSMVNTMNLKSALGVTSDLTESELASLLKMKEEEKLARDVYSALYQIWGNSMFSRISGAENNHMNAIIQLLQYYGSADTLIDEAGTFADDEVQTLYNNLVAKGSESIAEACKTGVLIEEMDIKDLSDGIALTSNANIIMVFENLQRGSRNHLRSFYNQLTILGVSYTPVYLTQAEYDQIVTSAMEKGKQYKKQGNVNGNSKGNGNGNGIGNRNGNGNGNC